MSTSSQNSWRWVALFVFTLVNLLNYIDRYIFSALLPAIQTDLGFSDTQLGLLGSAFILAYLVVSPVFGFIGDRGRRNRVMASGLALWSGATAMSGVAMTFSGQLLTRIAVGLGESAYSVIAPSSIADYFSKKSRGRVFAIYSGAIPVGSALGYMIGGWLEPRIGWHKTFFVVGLPGLLLALLLFFMRDPERGAQEYADSHSQLKKSLSLKQTYSRLFKNGGFMCTVMGYAAYTFVVGGMAFWMPMYIVRYFDVSLEKGNIVFGGVTVVGGFIGTLFGGWLADRIERSSGNGFLKVSAGSILLTVPLFFLVLSIQDFTRFAAVLFVMEIFLFMCISPLDAAVISYVRPAMRSTAMALNVFLIHLLGDGISRVLMGAVSDSSGLHSAISLLPWVLVIAGLFWLAGLIFFWQPAHWPVNALELPKWQAHRGFRPASNVQENTLQAFQLAKEAGAEMFECDIQLSKDNEAVVFHDPDLKRIGGSNEKVSDLTAAEMKERVGAPSLLEVLKDSRVPSLVNIELKTSEVRGNGALENAVVRAVKQAGAEERVLFSSFNPFCLHRLAKRAPDIPRALLATERTHSKNRFWLKRLWFGFWAQAHLVHLDENGLGAERIEALMERGIKTVPWTVNDRARADELFAQGVPSIISDTLFNSRS